MIKRFLKFTALIEITPEDGKWVGRSPMLKLVAEAQSPEDVMKEIERLLKEAGGNKQTREVLQYVDLKAEREKEKQQRAILRQEAGTVGRVSAAVAERPVEVETLAEDVPAAKPKRLTKTVKVENEPIKQD